MWIEVLFASDRHGHTVTEVCRRYRHPRIVGSGPPQAHGCGFMTRLSPRSWRMIGWTEVARFVTSRWMRTAQVLSNATL
jgi:hypothetical protein